jgi:2-polyprenyl-6-hydroxyphenyl methylase/3-demethylubiquinone-9 3-methyltransferase
MESTPMATFPTADNTVYETLSDSWWDEHGALNLLRTTVNPWRVPYFTKLLKQHTSTHQPPGLLDVGCGGGLLAEEFARLNCAVIGIDPSESSLRAARAHATQNGLHIDYRCAFGNALPFADATFDVASCCDVLEHIENWDATIAEIARVLKPGGLFLFDTINRTAYSWLVNILIAQDLPSTNFLPKNLHVWNMFIKPKELKASMNQHGMTMYDLVGASLKGNPLNALKAIRQFKQGNINAQEVGKIAALHPSRNIYGSYMGYAIKS